MLFSFFFFVINSIMFYYFYNMYALLNTREKIIIPIKIILKCHTFDTHLRICLKEINYSG